MSDHKSHVDTAHGTEAHAHHGPKHPARTFLITLLCLLALTFITVGAASIDFGSGNVVIALGIATVKASLVTVIFMHLRWEKPVNAVLAMAGFLFLGIMLLFCFLDVSSRRDPQPENLKPPAAAAAPGAPAAPAAGAERH